MNPDDLCDFCATPMVKHCRACSTQWCENHAREHKPIHDEAMDDYAREGIEPPSAVVTPDWWAS